MRHITGSSCLLFMDCFWSAHINKYYHQFVLSKLLKDIHAHVNTDGMFGSSHKKLPRLSAQNLCHTLVCLRESCHTFVWIH
jgi:adenine-specific DNA methylase